MDISPLAPVGFHLLAAGAGSPSPRTDGVTTGNTMNLTIHADFISSDASLLTGVVSRPSIWTGPFGADASAAFLGRWLPDYCRLLSKCWSCMKTGYLNKIFWC
ncbi:uncharacterized protein LOC133922026 [Phragmites australis]|uniref:uncharacterized protein LOC133922026 n=1 Tax=Phragmites australis TaxID=29695 RepID=UPI002D78C7BB|nr:uncharacterized protein LOC133922026 [Phragmites australis]